MKTLKNGKTLLVVGPQPPPVGGGTISVQILLEEMAKHATMRIIAINTSPGQDLAEENLKKREVIRRSLRIIRQYARNIRKSDAVLVVASARSQFIFTQGSVLLLLARLCRVPFYLKPLGSILSRRLEAHKNPVRSYMLMILRATTGVLAQTRQLQSDLIRLGVAKTHYLPGYRPVVPAAPPPQTPGEFRLIYLSQIERRKGPLLVLEALRILEQEHDLIVGCDFYGSVLGEDREEFFSELARVTGAKYRGVAQPGEIPRMMRAYSALVFPTYHFSEGHPGAIIEAMQAGIPVISTHYRAAAELVSDGENGFVVPMGDATALALAIKRLRLDAPLRERMGQANYLRGQEFGSDVVIARLIEIMFPGIHPLENSQ